MDSADFSILDRNIDRTSQRQQYDKYKKIEPQFTLLACNLQIESKIKNLSQTINFTRNQKLQSNFGKLSIKILNNFLKLVIIKSKKIKSLNYFDF